MLLDQGLLSGVDVEAWAAPGAPSGFAALAATLGAQLDAQAALLGDAAATMATDGDPLVDAVAAGDLSDAEANQAAHVDTLDSATPGALSGHVDAQTGDLVGFNTDTASDIAAGAPHAPGYVPHALDEAGNPAPPPPIGEAPAPAPIPSYPQSVGDQIDAWYRAYLRRGAGVADINAWQALYGNLPAVLRGILASDEYAGKVRDLYQAIFGRDVQADELAAARDNQWTLDQVEADLRRRA